MKLGLLTRVISLGVFCSSVFVNAKKAVELEGIIKNYSNVPNSSLVVEAQFKCRIQDVLGWYKPCGDQYATSAVTPDGRFHIPDLHAGDNLVVGRLVAEFTYELKVTATNEEGKTVYLLSKSVDYNSASDLRKLSQYSLYQIPAQRITFAPLSGGSSAGWVAGEGRDAILRWNVQFGAGNEENEFNNVTSAATGGVDFFPGQLFLVEGLSVPNPVVQMKVTVESPAANFEILGQGLYRGPLVPVLPRSVGVLVVKTNANYQEPKIDGQWALTINEHQNYQLGKPSGFYDAEMNVICLNGRELQGSIRMASRPGSTLQYKGVLPIRGRCEGGKGTAIILTNGLLGDGNQQIQFSWDRVSGKTLFTRELTDWELRDSEVEVIQLKLKDPQNNIIGTVTTQKGKNIYLP